MHKADLGECNFSFIFKVGAYVKMVYLGLERCLSG